jgi:hypothetical protein
MLRPIFIFVFLALAISSNAVARKPLLTHGRLDMRTCNHCHSMTYGFPGTGNLAAERSELCLICHSEKSRGEILDKPVVKKERMQRYVAKTDILSELSKPFVHPIQKTSQLHSRREELPERDPRAPRHVACVDCHDYHQVTSRNKLGPVKVTGATGEVKRFKDVRDMMPGEEVSDYELCFNCHADSANLPLNQTNKRVEFSTNNPSYHPVIGEGKNTVVPSLKPPYAALKKRSSDISTIKCGDCHGNNDEKGPKGPHGSTYPFILVRNYNINDAQPESSFQYALCYMCHERDSILRNDSFRYHSLHIQGNPNTGSLGTSCYTCHNSHGSTDNKFLIKFNRDVVFPNVSSGQLRFVSTGTFSGECYLSCHNVSHNPKRY